MAINKSRAAKTERIAGKTQNTNKSPTVSWDKESKPDIYDGRENKQAGDAGKEPGGRWSDAYYERPAAVVGRNTVRKP